MVFVSILYQNSKTVANVIYKISRRTYSIKSLTPDTPIHEIQQNGIRELVLNIPKTKNSLSLEVMDSLLKGFTNEVDNTDLRCIILSARGSVFSAGHNLKELVPERGSEFHRSVFEKCHEMLNAIRDCPIPVIAKVDGLAAAAGCQLVASCDMAVCTYRSKFSTPGANFGLFCSTPGIALARVMPKMKALQMLITGQPISGEEAYLAGLVSTVVHHDSLDNEIEKICEAIKSKSREILTLGKQFFYNQVNMNTDEAYTSGGEIMTYNLGLDNGKEGIMSFINKRKPSWIS